MWLGWIDRLLAANVDGIDLRISAHGTLTDEPLAYGFNEPVVEEYRQRYGVDIRSQAYDADRLSRLRGERYTAFVRECSRRVRKLGKRLQVHVHTEAFRPNPCHGRLMGLPTNIHFDWQAWLSDNLADAITLRLSWFEAMEDPLSARAQRSRLPGALDDPVVEEALALTARKKLPVYLNRYIGRAVGIDEYVSDLERIYHDQRFAGFDIYEFADFARPDQNGKIVPIGNWTERLRAKTKELGIAQ